MKVYWLLPCGLLIGCNQAAPPLAQPPVKASSPPAASTPAITPVSAQSAAPALPTVSALELQKAWENNRADLARYEGKTIAVTGMLQEIADEPSDDGFVVTFRDPRACFEAGVDPGRSGWWLINVFCYFDRQDQLRGLDTEEPVKIIGQVHIDDRVRLVHCRNGDR